MERDSIVEWEFIWERLREECPWWAVLIPVAAALILYPVVMFQSSRRSGGPIWSDLLTRLIGPPWALALLLVGCSAYIFLGIQLSKAIGWWLVLGTVLTIAFFYIGFMYYRDSRSVGYGWATFLGVLRSAVYLILAAVFLLPAEEPSERKPLNSRVVVVFDVSASMLEVDDVAQRGQKLSDLPTRQDKVIQRLAGDQGRFLKNVLKTNPLTCYRFGKGLHDDTRQYASHPFLRRVQRLVKTMGDDAAIKDTWSERELHEWLVVNSDSKNIDGTNIGDSLVQLLNREREVGSLKQLQAIIVVSDGQNNEGQDQAYEDLRAMADKDKIPIMCIGVGKYKPPISIKVNDLEVPNTARPDEPFPVVVPVLAQGLKGQEYEVQLEVRRTENGDGKAVREKAYPLAKKSIHREGEQDRVEFEINVAELKGIDPKDEKLAGELEGTWEFRARVKRNEREAFNKPFHTTDQPAKVRVLKKKLRVLLFAGGPSQEYKFVKTLLYREAIEGRMQVGVYLQTNPNEEIDLDEKKPQEWILDHFPDREKRERVEQMPYTLPEYDLVIAMDPDWRELSTPTLKMLEDWVKERHGGIVFVGGIVNTFWLARPPKEPDLTTILNLLPVYVDDSRLEGVGGDAADSSKQSVLKFPGANARFDFLKLNEEGTGSTAGWNEYFYGTPDPDRDSPIIRGMYSYYPVKQAKSVATVIATFPVARTVGGEGLKGDQPYMVYMEPGNGKSFFIGSQELWRLRRYRTTYHERYWIKLIRFIGSGSAGRLQKFGESNIPERMVAGKRRIEYRLRGLDQKFLKKDRAADLTVIMRRFNKLSDTVPNTDPKLVTRISLKAKPGIKGEESGWFMADVNIEDKRPEAIMAALEKDDKENQVNFKIQFQLKIPGTPETLTDTVIVTKPNPELDNTRPNLAMLFELASDNRVVMSRPIGEAVKRQLKELDGPEEDGEKSVGRKGKRLYFDLNSATLIPDCLVKIPDRYGPATKGQPVQLWDKGWDSGEYLFGVPFQFSTVMGVIVLLLSVEWLARKLLKLA